MSRGGSGLQVLNMEGESVWPIGSEVDPERTDPCGWEPIL